MTTEQTENIPQEKIQTHFTSRFLPWIIAVGIFLVYFFTLNHWVTLKSLPVVAKVAGWDWRPTTIAPLYFLLTYPFHWLSGNAQLVALNFFSAICAALTLAQLARSVTLLPQDRTRDQRQRETGKFALLNVRQAWLPPVVAVLVCGLQLTFWENAVTATREMLELLLFAYVIRCLLEYRISKRENWLTKFVLVYGMAVTNNWAMIGFFPFFLTALIWIKARSFFNLRFILRMAGFGVIGLSLYFLLPLLAVFSGNSGLTFWEALRENYNFQKTYLYVFPFVQVTNLRGRLFLIALTTLVPLLMIAIRWPSFRGDVSPAGTNATTFMFRLMHLIFLAIGLWLFFDPPFSPRTLSYDLMTFLAFYYLSALTIGYLVGYILQVFGQKPVQAWARASRKLKMIDPIVLTLAWIAVVAAPIALFKKNLPLIQATNSNVLNQFSKWTAESLPSGGAVVLSDDPTRLYLLRAVDLQMGRPADNLLLDTSSLTIPAYHKYLHSRHAKDWPETSSTNQVDPMELIQRMDVLSKSHQLFYLHPSFGYYFERFYPTPHRLVYQLQPYATNVLMPPALTGAVIDDNQKFWNSFGKDVLPNLPALAEKSPEVRYVSSCYSRAWNYWGVELQKAKMLKEAEPAFAGAFKLNPENVVAQINQEFNATLRKGEIRGVEPDDELEKKLGQYRDLQTAMNWNGPFDEPNFSLSLAETFARGGNLRQSAHLFIRVLELAPQHFGARLGLAKTYIELQRSDESLKLVRQLRDDPIVSTNANAAFELLRVEALAYMSKNDFPKAEKVLLDATEQNPKDPNPLALLTQLYLDLKQYTNALQSAEKQLQIAPDPRALFTKAVLNMQLGQFAAAVVTLDQLLKLQPDNNNALFNRAIANLQSGKLDAAKRDYEALRGLHPVGTYQIYYGLAQVAEKQNDKAAAIKHYKLYSKYAPSGTGEYEEVQKRLKLLGGGKK